MITVDSVDEFNDSTVTQEKTVTSTFENDDEENANKYGVATYSLTKEWVRKSRRSLASVGVMTHPMDAGFQDACIPRQSNNKNLGVLKPGLKKFRLLTGFSVTNLEALQFPDGWRERFGNNFVVGHLQFRCTDEFLTRWESVTNATQMSSPPPW